MIQIVESPRPKPVQVGAGRWRHRRVWKIKGVPRTGPIAFLCCRQLKEFSLNNPSLMQIEGEPVDKESISFEGPPESGDWVLSLERIVVKPDF